MKYYLRSFSADQQTAQLSVAFSEGQYASKKNKIKKQMKKNFKNKNMSKKKSKKQKNNQRSTKRSNIKQIISKQQPIHEKIFRFPLKFSKRTLRVYCYKQQDLGFQKRFCRSYGVHKRDDDQQSWDSLIQAEVQRCKETLFEGIRKHTSQVEKSSSINKNDQSAKQQINNLEESSVYIDKKKTRKGRKKISKRQKNKRK